MINFSDMGNINRSIELEKISLTSKLDIQNNLNKQILIIIKNFMANINLSDNIAPDDKTFLFLTESTNYLNKSNSNINMLKQLIDCLDKINILAENLEEELINYNNNLKEYINCIYANTEAIEKFIYQVTITDFSQSYSISDNSSTELSFIDSSRNTTESITINSSSNAMESVSINSFDNTLESVLINSLDNTVESAYNNNTVVCTNNSCSESTSLESNCVDNSFIENTLIISETQKKVILPYNLNEIKNILQNNEKGCHTLQEVINKFYTKPISYYKVSSISRFKEAYKLVTEKEKGSKLKALGLAFELFGNYNLHPAVITSCNSLDELDIYLACLEENSLEDFHFFNIKYEIPLAISN